MGGRGRGGHTHTPWDAAAASAPAKYAAVCKAEMNEVLANCFHEGGAPRGLQTEVLAKTDCHDCGKLSRSSHCKGKKKKRNRMEVKIGEVWRIYLPPAAGAARLIGPGCDDFSGSATKISEARPGFWGSRLGSKFSEFPSALILQSCRSRSASRCDAPPSPPPERPARSFLCDGPPSHS